MNDPRRLAEQDRALAALLGAARGYRAPPRARRRVLRMLGLPVALSLAGLASSASGGVLAALSKVSLQTWVIVGAVTAAGGGSAMVAYSDRQEAPGPRAHIVAAPAPAPAPRRASPPPAPGVVAPVPPPAPVAPASARPPRPVVRSRPPAVVGLAAAPRAQPVSTEPPPVTAPPLVLPRRSPVTRTVLAAELALLGAAERALRRNAPAQALDALDQYRRQFPAGNLREEAVVLEIQAYLTDHRPDLVRDRATRFLAEHPGSVFAARVRGMLGAASTPDGQTRPASQRAPGERQQP